MAQQGGNAGKRGPTILVTDSREQPSRQRQSFRPNHPPSRFVTVDNVLQYASDIPSMQQRHPPQGMRVRPRSRLGAAGGAMDRSPAAGATGSSIGAQPRMRSVSRLASQPHLPSRTTKVSEKLVLLPETDEMDEEEAEKEEMLRDIAEEEGEGSDVLRRLAARERMFKKDREQDFDVDNESAPLMVDEALRRHRLPPEKSKSYAERLPKSRRAEKLSRVTAYCTAQAYKLNSTAAFLRDWHGANTKLYDDCLYTAYHLPLLPGKYGYRLRSSPALKSAGGKAVLDEEIERNERRDYHEEYLSEEDEHSVRHSDQHHEHGHGQREERRGDEDEPHRDDPEIDGLGRVGDPLSPLGPRRVPPNAFAFAEMFVFSYGVVVFWNFTEKQEKDVLADLSFSTSPTTGAPLSLATVPLASEDFETEEFHFEYSTEISRPRVYNDMITLRSGDHMIKLAISHGIAQSTKLSFFEENMSREMAEAKDVPRRLALTGHLGMKREEVFRIMGRLFKSRVEVNLSSNMLDVPNFFWDSEPTLHPLYIAVREYLEIKPRIQVLNERCRVFLDLIEILSDSIADSQMSRQTWIIIILIAISIVVTISEVILRFGMLSTSSGSSSSSSSPILPFTPKMRGLNPTQVLRYDLPSVPS
ncbi:hypothetical protein FQN54_000381 [Arachnomyces sp. PD_36]|nr:hypothetical protein FQN54_000381 [Arachnomyces sp. PD_36]